MGMGMGIGMDKEYKLTKQTRHKYHLLEMTKEEQKKQ